MTRSVQARASTRGASGFLLCCSFAVILTALEYRVTRFARVTDGVAVVIAQLYFTCLNRRALQGIVDHPRQGFDLEGFLQRRAVAVFLRKAR